MVGATSNKPQNPIGNSLGSCRRSTVLTHLRAYLELSACSWIHWGGAICDLCTILPRRRATTSSSCLTNPHELGVALARGQSTRQPLLVRLRIRGQDCVLKKTNRLDPKDLLRRFTRPLDRTPNSSVEHPCDATAPQTPGSPRHQLLEGSGGMNVAAKNLSHPLPFLETVNVDPPTQY